MPVTYIADQPLVARSDGPHPDSVVRLAEEYAAYDKHLGAIVRDGDVPDEAIDEDREKIEHLARTPATTIRGVYEKLAVAYLLRDGVTLPPVDLEFGADDDEYDVCDLMADGAMIDARRLATAQGDGPIATVGGVHGQAVEVPRPAPPTPPASTLDGERSRLQGLRDDWARALRETQALRDSARDAEQQMQDDGWPPNPWQISACAAVLPEPLAPVQAMLDRVWRLEYERRGIEALCRRRDDLDARRVRLEQRIKDAPINSLEDLAIKLDVALSADDLPARDDKEWRDNPVLLVVRGLLQLVPGVEFRSPSFDGTPKEWLTPAA